MADGKFNQPVEVKTLHLGQVAMGANDYKWVAVPDIPGYTKLGIVGYSLAGSSATHVYAMGVDSLALRNNTVGAQTVSDLVVNVLVKQN